MSGRSEPGEPFDTFFRRAARCYAIFFLLLVVPQDSSLVWQIPPLALFIRSDWLILMLRNEASLPIRVRRADTLELASWQRRVVREMPLAGLIILRLAVPGPWPVAIMVGWVALSAFVAFADKRSRAPHDFLAGTVKMVADLYPDPIGAEPAGPPAWARLQSPAGDDRKPTTQRGW